MHVRPERVVEIAFDGVQTSPQYRGGVALRFARLKRYRPDMAAAVFAPASGALACARSSGAFTCEPGAPASRVSGRR